MAGKKKKQSVSKKSERAQDNFLFLNWLLPLSSVFFLVYLGASLFSEKTGIIGLSLADFFKFYLGNGSLVLTLTLLYFSVGYLRWQKPFLKISQVVGFALANLAVLPTLALILERSGLDISLESVFRQGGGFLGSAILHMFLPVFGHFGLVLLLVFFFFIALLLVSGKQPYFYLALAFSFFKKLLAIIKKTFAGIFSFGNKGVQKIKENSVSKKEEGKFTEGKHSHELPLQEEPGEAVQAQHHLEETDPKKNLTPIKLMVERMSQLGGKKEKAEEFHEKEPEGDKVSLEIKEESDDVVGDLDFEIKEGMPSAPKIERKVATLQADAEVVYGLEEVDPESDLGSGNEKVSFQNSVDIFVDSPYGQIEPFEIPEGEFMETVMPAEKANRYKKPSLDLLIPGKPLEDKHYEELEENTKTLEQTLAVFGVNAKVVNISYGPTITRYELQLAPGIRVSKVANLADDIALSLAASGVRIEAPIPGKPAIGIEVPNKEINVVTLRDVLDSEEFQKAESGVIVPLGKDIAGRTIVADLSKMPHLLIAGATGSGKSVCMNCMITSLLYRFSPEQIKMIMIDPKVVEMSNYNGVPHLLSPVVTDPKKASGVLKSVTREMDRRYDLFAAFAVKNIGQYNEKVLKEGEREPLPYWIVFIDELADLMIVARDEVEESIIRIAQLARAAGIHLVIGTQRPSSDIITGSIKANIPSRIAFAVSSGVDSRIILDMNGAEKLLGRGDMLFQPMGLTKPVRIQGSYISETEVESVVKHVKQQGIPVFDEAILNPDENGTEGEILSDVDELFMEAAYIVIETGQGSVSYLQRRLRVGHSRAGRIMDQLEENGIVGPPQGSKPREVLISKEQLENKFG